ncbi:MAG: class I SAM-dependent methyltransferase [Bdellovibrionota bacterium]
MPEIEWSQAIERALAASPGLETWSGHFRNRITELEDVSRYWPGERVQRALEIGCGNGLAAIYFSPRADRIVASDLAGVDMNAHSIGLEYARKFIDRMNIKNVELLGCSAEAIPLPSQSFDLVYGIYCLEHVPDRPKALLEIRRVLKSGGQTLLTVPGFAWSLFYPFVFHYELGKRVAGRLKRKFFPAPSKESLPAGEATAQVKVTSAGSFFLNYPHFPLPEPHGTHSSWGAELLYYRASNWKRVMEAAGFTDVVVEPVSFLPAFVKALLPDSVSAAAERVFKRWPALAPWAQFFCLRGIAPALPEKG